MGERPRFAASVAIGFAALFQSSMLAYAVGITWSSSAWFGVVGSILVAIEVRSRLKEAGDDIDFIIGTGAILWCTAWLTAIFTGAVYDLRFRDRQGTVTSIIEGLVDPFRLLVICAMLLLGILTLFFRFAARFKTADVNALEEGQWRKPVAFGELLMQRLPWLPKAWLASQRLIKVTAVILTVTSLLAVKQANARHRKREWKTCKSLSQFLADPATYDGVNVSLKGVTLTSGGPLDERNVTITVAEPNAPGSDQQSAERVTFFTHNFVGGLEPESARQGTKLVDISFTVESHFGCSGEKYTAEIILIKRHADWKFTDL